MRRPHRRSPGIAVAAALFVLAAAVLGVAPGGAATAPPLAPLAFDRELLSNLTAPDVEPGGSTSVSFRLYDPAGFGSLSGVVLSLGVYALNGYPGDAVGPVPLANPPVLENASASGESVNVTLATLPTNTSYSGSVAVVTSATTPAGTYAIRTSLAFVENKTGYVFRSRGWFTLAAWENATEETNGTATVNASRLGVSGILPETAVLVAPSGWPVALGALLAVGFVLVGLGAWLYFRRGPKSSSGVGSPAGPGATNAPRALGNSRNSPGDSRKS